MAKSSIVLAAAILLSGCAASVQVQPTKAEAAPTERLKWSPPLGADSTVRVARDVGFVGGGCYLALFINGTLAGRFAPGERAEFKVSSGEVLLGVGHDPEGRGLCAGNLGKTVVNSETMLRAGESKSFRLMIGGRGELDIRRADS